MEVVKYLVGCGADIHSLDDASKWAEGRSFWREDTRDDVIKSCYHELKGQRLKAGDFDIEKMPTLKQYLELCISEEPKFAHWPPQKYFDKIFFDGVEGRDPWFFKNLPDEWFKGIILEFMEFVVHPKWIRWIKVNHPGVERVIQKVAKGRDLLLKIREGGRSPGQLTADLNIVKNISHNTGNMVNDYIADVEYSDFTKMSNADTDEWDEDLRNLGVQVER